jgi:hypothetical protein
MLVINKSKKSATFIDIVSLVIKITKSMSENIRNIYVCVCVNVLRIECYFRGFVIKRIGVETSQ